MATTKRRTVGERDRARGSTVSRPRSEEAARRRYMAQKERVAAAKANGAKPRPQDVTDRADVDAMLRDDRIAKGRERIDNAPTGAGTVRLVSSQLSPVFVPLVIEAAIIAADEIVQNKRFPIPSRFVAAFALFGTLSFATGEAEGAAKMLAWSVVLATFYNTVTKSPSTLSKVGGFFAGNPTGSQTANENAVNVLGGAPTETTGSSPNQSITQGALRAPGTGNNGRQ